MTTLKSRKINKKYMIVCGYGVHFGHNEGSIAETDTLEMAEFICKKIFEASNDELSKIISINDDPRIRIIEVTS